MMKINFRSEHPVVIVKIANSHIFWLPSPFTIFLVLSPTLCQVGNQPGITNINLVKLESFVSVLNSSNKNEQAIYSIV